MRWNVLLTVCILIFSSTLIFNDIKSNAILDSKTGYVDIGKAKLYYEEKGKGQALIMIHGGLLDRRMWDDQFDVFAKQFRVIRYDVRNHGLSKSDADEYYNYKDLHNLLEKMNIQKANIMGLSLGGKIAIDFALEFPEKVTALILVAPGLSGYEFKSEKVVENSKKLQEAWSKGDLDLAIEFFQRSWTDGPHRKPSQIAPSVREKVKAMALNSAKNWNSEAILLQLNPPAIERINEIRLPTLAVAGSLDMPGILEIVDKIENNIPGAQKVIIPGVAHMVNMEKPKEFNKIILDYLSNLKLPKP
jgi:pimeloyl-ACP methyl ester carboxylesterase